jgi:hypothetical protein
VEACLGAEGGGQASKSLDFGGLGSRQESIWRLARSELWQENDFMAWRAQSSQLSCDLTPSIDFGR